jgi:uncharacterized protein (TIGR03086 family)
MGCSPDARRLLIDEARTVDHTDGDPAGRRVAELIELGRDREAADLATAIDRDPARHRGGPMDALAQLDQLGPVLAGVVGGISPSDLDNPTTSTAFTVRGVLEHMIGGATMFTAAFRGEAPGTPDLDDVLGAFGPTLTTLAEAIHAPGALDRTIAAPFGEVTGEAFARFVVLDGLVHGWDMATATGQAYDPPAALVSAATEFARGALDPLRDGTTFADATEPPAGATPLEALVAYTGRSL